MNGDQPRPASGVRPPGEERALRTERLQIERKSFILALRENPRGRFVRITEDVGGRRDTVIVPASGLEAFIQALKSISLDAQPPPPPGSATVDSAASADG